MRSNRPPNPKNNNLCSGLDEVVGYCIGYFAYLLLCISCFWSGKCSETGEVTISLCGMKNSNQKQLYITAKYNCQVGD